MKKVFVLGMTTLTIMTSWGAISTQAAGAQTYRNASQGKLVSYVQKGNGSCDINNILGQFQSQNGDKNCVYWRPNFGNGNCPILPDFDSGNNGGNNNGDVENDNNGGNNGDNNQNGGNNGGNSDNDNTVTPDDEAPTYAEQVVALVNKERAKEGLAPLTIQQDIVKAASVRAGEIQNSFSHTRPNGTSFTTALKEAGVSYRGAGENIAWGQKTPEEVVKAWMNSPSHRENIMNKNFTNMGVGYQTNNNGVAYWVQLFTY